MKRTECSLLRCPQILSGRGMKPLRPIHSSYILARVILLCVCVVGMEMVKTREMDQNEAPFSGASIPDSILRVLVAATKVVICGHSLKRGECLFEALYPGHRPFPMLWRLHKFVIPNPSEDIQP